MRRVGWRTVFTIAWLARAAVASGAPQQDAQPAPDMRQVVIEDAQADKVNALHPYVPTKGERLMTKVQDVLVYPTETWTRSSRTRTAAEGSPPASDTCGT